MKYFAILRDSLREAIDTKVFYALAALSLLVVLLVGSISYTPVDAAEAFGSIVKDQAFHLYYSNKGTNVIPQFSHFDAKVQDVKALTDASEPNARDHSFKLTIREYGAYAFQEAVVAWSSPTEGALHPRRFDPTRVSSVRAKEADMADFLKHQLWSAGNIDVVDIRQVSIVEPDMKAQPPTGGSYVYEVKTKGHAGVRGWRHDASLLFGLLDLPAGMFRTTLSGSVFFIEDNLIGGFGAWIAIMLGVVVTAFFIPNMLRKGTIDMLIAKPIYRPTLLIYKYIGGLTFVFLSSVIAVGGCWIALGLRSGIWATGFLLMIGVITFFFAILYSISTLFGVLTRSPIVAILVTCFVWFALFLVGKGYELVSVVKSDARGVVAEMEENGWGWVLSTVDTLHFVLPRTGDLNALSAQMLAQVLTPAERNARHVDKLSDLNWGESLTVSFAFVAVMLGLSCWFFSRKDF